MNVHQLTKDMEAAIREWSFRRTAGDPASPSKGPLIEAKPFSQFTVQRPMDNAAARAFDRRWAIANALHFFADTERAEVLRKYNKHADRFLTPYPSLEQYVWHGAYGAACMEQVRRCVTLLQSHPDSRRAVVTMGSASQQHTINTPQCWNCLHFLQGTDSRLHAHCYQRSLSMRVMPYDAVVLTNVLCYVAHSCKMQVGTLTWTVGSLHAEELVDELATTDVPQDPVLLPMETMYNPTMAWAWLNEEKLWTIE